MDWFIADTHFFHARVITYSERPWGTSEDMTEGLIKLWNSRVAKDDRVFVLGDFAFGNKSMIKMVVPRLHGNKILVRGNHDGRNFPFYVEAGFRAVSPLPMLYKEKYLLSHEPIRPLANGLINIHGHLHNGVNPYFYAPAHICVSVENTNYVPVNLEQVLVMLEEKNITYERLTAERAEAQSTGYDMRVGVTRRSTKQTIVYP